MNEEVAVADQAKVKKQKRFRFYTGFLDILTDQGASTDYGMSLPFHLHLSSDSNVLI